LPYLVWLDILLVLYFPLSSLAKMLSEPAVYTLFFLFATILSAFFVASLFLLRRDRHQAASYAAMAGLVLEVGNLALFVPFSSWSDLYRVGAFVIGSTIVAGLAVFKRAQVFAYYAASLAISCVYVLTKALPIGGLGKEGLATIFIYAVLLTASSLGVLLLHDLNTRLVALATTEAVESGRRARMLRALVSSAAGILETGRELSEAAREGRRRSSEIRARLDSLRGAAEELSRSSVEADRASSSALGRAGEAKASVEKQGRVIGEAEAAVERIRSAIAELSDLAGERRSTVQAVAGRAEGLRQSMKGLLDGVERIRSSSAAVMEAASGILDVSEKTNLLAMNASIEAAHAGASGKGFAVISDEVRKLSRETQESTKRIGEAIKANDATVRSQAEVMKDFTVGMGEMIADVAATVESLGEMMTSLERMGEAADGLCSSTGSMLALAGEARGSVLGVAEGIEAGAGSAASAKDFAVGLAQELSLMLEAFASLDAAVEKAADMGGKSLERLSELDSGLSTAGEA
jgi:Methyl-accepting chemotaxis protein